MKIISKFTDYYDHVVHTFGEDEKSIYLRETEKVSSKGFFKNYRAFGDRRVLQTSIERGSGRLITTVFVLGFCGEYHIGVIRSESHLDDILFEPKEYSETGIKGRSYNDYKEINATVGYSFWFKDKVVEDLEVIKKEDLFTKLNVPCFLVTANGIITNPILKTVLKFQTIEEPIQAYQKLEMYLSQMSNTETEIVTTDLNKVEQHGFDKVWSFRNPDPPKRKMK